MDFFFFLWKINVLFKDLFSKKSRACEKGYKIRILHYPLSRLTREQELWARYTTPVVTESDLWMSSLRSHSCSSFKVFPSVLHYMSRVFIWQGWWLRRSCWFFITSDWWWVTCRGALRCERLLPLSPCVQQHGGKPVCFLARLKSTFHASPAFVFPINK